MPISDALFEAALLYERFDVFLRYAFAELNGGRRFAHNWHIDAMIHQLDRLRLDEIQKLIVTLPPRHLKSQIISIAWVAWMLGRNPSLRFICASYDLDLAEKLGRQCLRLLNADWYQQAFPGTRLSRRVASDFETTKGGGRLCASTDSGVTGRGGDFLIIDDPIRPDHAESEAHRLACVEWYDGTLDSRLDDQTKPNVILLMQRLHEADLAGVLLRRGGWEELRLSAIATRDELVPLTGGRFHQRREGCALHPQRQPLSVLEAKRQGNPYIFASQYLQDPIARIGAFVQPEWFETYDQPPQAGTMVMSCDTAVKTTVRSDWSVLILARYYMGRFYILDVWRRRVEFPELLENLVRLCREHRVDHLLIEDASSGQQLIQQIRQDAPPGVTFPLAIKPMLDKRARFEAQASRIKAGTVVLPQAAPWLPTFLAEITKFPNGDHDDQADALGQMLANPPPELPHERNEGPILMSAHDPLPPPQYDEYGNELDPWGAY